jgi:flavin-binding protein dodecin
LAEAKKVVVVGGSADSFRIDQAAVNAVADTRAFLEIEEMRLIVENQVSESSRERE